MIPLFDLELSAGTLIFSARALLLFLLGAALFGSFSFKQAAAEWNSSVPFSVALLRGAVEAKHVDGVYTGSTLALVVIVGGTFGDPFSGLTLLLLWELFFLLQLIFYHFHNPEYGIPALYASYIVPRGKRLLLGAVITATGYTVSELGKMKIHDMGETYRSIRRDDAFVEVNTQNNKIAAEKTRVKYDFENNKLKTKYEFKTAEVVLENNKTALEREKIAFENNKIALENNKIAAENKKIALENKKIDLEIEKLKARNSSWWPRSSDLKTD